MTKDQQPRAQQRTVLYSSEANSDARLHLGSTHYSYGIVAQRFAAMFARGGHRTIAVTAPEKYKRLSDIAAAFGECAGMPIHMSFRATENLRPIPAARNIAHFAWEFDDLKDRELVSRPITQNQTHMLSLMDEIWVPSTYTLDALRRHGLSRAFLVPTPVCGPDAPVRRSRRAVLDTIGLVPATPMLLSSGLSRERNADLLLRSATGLAGLPQIAAWQKGEGRVFLTICNPEDLRKNLLGIIDGFLFDLAEGSRDLLVVKLVVPSTEHRLGGAQDEHLKPRYKGPVAEYHPNVVFISEYLDDEEMGALFSLADFYVCASHCEGHNLPLLEAMAHGTCAISTANTAMGDYISDDTAVVIAERRYHGLVPGLMAEISGITPSIAVASRHDVARAIGAAKRLRPDEYRAKADRGRALVLERYSEAAVAQLVAQRLRAVANDPRRPSLAH
ncbi:MAG TPA: glycosyltransferase [Rhizomicrobium sp.]